MVKDPVIEMLRIGWNSQARSHLKKTSQTHDWMNALSSLARTLTYNDLNATAIWSSLARSLHKSRQALKLHLHAHFPPLVSLIYNECCSVVMFEVWIITNSGNIKSCFLSIELSSELLIERRKTLGFSTRPALLPQSFSILHGQVRHVLLHSHLSIHFQTRAIRALIKCSILLRPFPNVASLNISLIYN